MQNLSVILLSRSCQAKTSTKEQPIFPVGSNPDFERLPVAGRGAENVCLVSNRPERCHHELECGCRGYSQYPREDFVGKYVAELFTPEDRAVKMPERELQKAAETGTASDVRWHVRKDGTRFCGWRHDVGAR